MLKTLKVHNFGLFPQATIDLSPGLTVISGTTGSGKSLLFDAISLFLERSTNRAASSLKKNLESSSHLMWESEGKVAQYSRVCNKGSVQFLHENRRCTQKNVRATLSSKILLANHIREILDKENHAFFLLPCTVPEATLTGIHGLFESLQSSRQKVSSIQSYMSNPASSKMHLEKAIQELENANIKPDELQDLEQERHQLLNLNKLQDLVKSIEHINSDEPNISKALSQVEKNLQKTEGSIPPTTFESLSSNLSIIKNSLNILSNESSHLASSICVENEVDSRIIACNERTALIENLQQKHNTSAEFFNEKMEEMRTLLSNQSSLQAQMEDALEDLRIAETSFTKKSLDLLKIFQKNERDWRHRLETILGKLDMPDTQVRITAEERPKSHWNSFGTHAFILKMATNASQHFFPPLQILSGGELSRLSLAMHTLSAEKHAFSTLLFDEIEMGLSPDVCEEVGSVLSKIAQHKQVVLISHSPQIACFADKHYTVTKQKSSSEYTSSAQELTTDESKIKELTRMLASKKDSEALAQKLAQNLLTKAFNEKKS